MNNLEVKNMKNIYFISISIIIAGIIIAGAIVSLGRGGNISEKSQITGTLPPSDSDSLTQPTQPSLVVTEKDHIRGDFNAPVTIIEFSDFQCPFCQKFHPTVQQILDNYPGQVRWVYKHFPLVFHEQAQPAAEASECAAEQGKFWQFADGLFENQTRLGSALYKELASQIGLNVAQFDNCISSGKYKSHVQEDYQEGVAAGVTGTPGSFVNGELVSGAVPYSTLEAVVKSILAQ